MRESRVVAGSNQSKGVEVDVKRLSQYSRSEKDGGCAEGMAAGCYNDPNLQMDDRSRNRHCVCMSLDCHCKHQILLQSIIFG